MAGTAAGRGDAVREPRGLILPAWGYYLAFLLTPLCFIVAYAFAQNTGFFQVRFGLSGSNFHRLWDPLYLKIYLSTFEMALAGTIGCLLIGYPFAYWLATRPHRHRTLLILLVVVPFWVSILLRTYAWALILAGNGPLSTALQKLHLIANPLGILNTSRAVWIGLVYDYLPLMLFPLYVSIDRVDRALIEASRDLGASRWSTFRKVSLPLTLPGILTGCLLVFVPMTGEYVVPSILGGGKSALFGPVVAGQFLEAIDYPFGAAMSLALVAFLLVVIFLYLRVLGRQAEQNLGVAM
jgi:spermidine/putrescine transport system permease protein